MIFVINNQKQWSDNRLYFIKAPARFEKWFEEVFVPHLTSYEVSYLPVIVAVAEKLEWRQEEASMSPNEFVDEYSFFTEEDPPPFK